MSASMVPDSHAFRRRRRRARSSGVGRDPDGLRTPLRCGLVQRTARPVCCRADGGRVGVDVELRTEAAAHRWGDDPDLALWDPGGGGRHHLQDVGHLGRAVERDVTAHRRRHGEHATGSIAAGIRRCCTNSASMVCVPFANAASSASGSGDGRWNDLLVEIEWAIVPSRAVAIEATASRGS